MVPSRCNPYSLQNLLLTLSHLLFDYQRVVQWARREQKCTDRQLAFILGFMVPLGGVSVLKK
jgi:hypothetical protein